jgi:hypothetical protein
LSNAQNVLTNTNADVWCLMLMPIQSTVLYNCNTRLKSCYFICQQDGCKIMQTFSDVWPMATFLECVILVVLNDNVHVRWFSSIRVDFHWMKTIYMTFTLFCTRLMFTNTCMNFWGGSEHTETWIFEFIWSKYGSMV